MTVLNDRALNRATLARQLLLTRAPLSVLNATEQLLALQAQIPRPPHIALWSRLAAFERADLIAPLQARSLVRATSMRGTLHIMRAKDFVAFRGALQPSLTAGMQTIVGKGPIPPMPELLTAARRVLGTRGLPFSDIRDALVKTFPTGHDRLMGYAVRMQIPIVQVPDAEERWGFPSDSDFAMAEPWLGTKIGEGDGPGAFVLRYLAAYGPSSVADIQTWTGFKAVAEIIKPLRAKLMTFTDARRRELFDLPKAVRPDEDTTAPVRFLPEYDSMILAHADRSRLIDERYRKALVTKNLIVPATFLVDGRVAGTWKIERKRKAATLNLVPFATIPKAAKAAIEQEGEALLRFVESDAETLSVR